MQTYEKITIDDVARLLEMSGWERITFRDDHFEFVKGKRFLKLLPDGSDGWELKCHNNDGPQSTLMLPQLLSIPTPVMFAVLEAYKIVTIITLAAAEGLVFGKEAAAV